MLAHEALQAIVERAFFVIAMGAASAWGGACAVLLRTWEVTPPGRRWFTSAVTWGGFCAMLTSIVWAIVLRPDAAPVTPGSLTWWLMAFMWALSQIGPVGAFIYVWRGIRDRARLGYYDEPSG